jgi:hypothetical protein
MTSNQLDDGNNDNKYEFIIIGGGIVRIWI